MTARRLSRPSPRLLTMGVAAVLALGLLGEGGAADTAAAAAGTTTPTAAEPSAQRGLRFAPASSTVEGYTYDGYVYLDSAVWMAAYGEGYEFLTKRAKASDPVTLTKTVIRGDKRTTTKAPAAIVDGLNGFKNGLTVQVVDANGTVLLKKTRSLCLGGAERQRVEPTGNTEPIYPAFCGGNWFTKSTVFGIEQGWAAQLDTYFEVKTTRRNLRMTVTISDPVANFLGLPADGRSVSQRVKVVDECELVDCGEVGEALLGEPDEGFSTLADGEPTAQEKHVRTLSGGSHAVHGDSTESTHRTNLFTIEGEGQAHGGDHPALGQPGSTPSNDKPAKDTLPDLVSVPAWQIGSERDGGVDRLTFNAHEWNAGPAPLVVEGYRRGAGEVMDAYQFFYRDGKEVGSTRTGTMKYHDAPEHDHWHFLDFAKLRAGQARRLPGDDERQAVVVPGADGPRRPPVPVRRLASGGHRPRQRVRRQVRPVAARGAARRLGRHLQPVPDPGVQPDGGPQRDLQDQDHREPERQSARADDGQQRQLPDRRPRRPAGRSHGQGSAVPGRRHRGPGRRGGPRVTHS